VFIATMKKTFAVPGEVVLDDLLAGFPHAVAVLDEGFKIVAVNQMLEALTGYSRGRVFDIMPLWRKIARHGLG
jgi:PAS domain-containing protein